MTYTITAGRSLILNGLQPHLLLTTLAVITAFDALAITVCLWALRRATT